MSKKPSPKNSQKSNSVLAQRPRRLRQNRHWRDLLADVELKAEDLILPLFVREGTRGQKEIGSMPGQFQLSPDRIVETLKKSADLGIRSFILFGVIEPHKKDAAGSEACNPNNLICRTLEKIKKAKIDMIAMADVCFCEYTSHGHCGILSPNSDIAVDNDATLPQLATQSVNLARAGADLLAPSGMMDGGVATMRRALDEAGFQQTVLMAYAVKYASSFYGPFRDAVESAPQFGDRRSYQMDFRRGTREAIAEAQLDLQQGADIVMVKPGLPYLDIIQALSKNISAPIAAYQVSGEYAMIKAAGRNGWIDETAVAMESLHSLKRAGAQLILTYFARDIARHLLRKK